MVKYNTKNGPFTQFNGIITDDKSLIYSHKDEESSNQQLFQKKLFDHKAVFKNVS